MDRTIEDLFADRYDSNWYLAARADVLTAVIAPLCGSGQGCRVVDVGAGTGSILGRLAGAVTSIGIEGSWDLASLGRRTHDVRFVVADLACGVPLASGSADVVLALDVLEHLDDERAAMAEVHRLLRPAGRLVLSVPAFQGLWSRHDELHHHRRRYSKPGLLGVLADAGFVCSRVTYFNSFLFPLVFLSRKLDGVGLAPRSSATDYDKPPRLLACVLRRVFGFEARVIPHANFPIGVSLLAVATKP